MSSKPIGNALLTRAPNCHVVPLVILSFCPILGPSPFGLLGSILYLFYASLCFLFALPFRLTTSYPSSYSVPRFVSWHAVTHIEILFFSCFPRSQSHFIIMCLGCFSWSSSSSIKLYALYLSRMSNTVLTRRQPSISCG